MDNQYGVGLYQDGVFYFTNPTKEDRTLMWNSKEYTFKAKTTVPLIISGQTPEDIQNIRRKFAFKLAQQVFHESKEYKDLVKKGGYIPATYDQDKVFADTIQACLTPLVKSQAEVKVLPKDNESNYKGTKAIAKGQDLNKVFEDYQIPELGTQ